MRNENASSENNSILTLAWTLTWITKFIGMIATDFAAHPFYTTWTVQQSVENNRSPSFLEAIQKIRKGRGFYSGFAPQAITAVPGTMLYFQGQEIALTLFGDNNFGQAMQGPLGVGFGMLAWSPAATLTMSQQVSGNSAVKNNFNHLSVFQKAKYIVKKDGVIRGFYRGTFPGFCAFSITDTLGFWMRAQFLAQFPEDKSMKLKLATTTYAFAIAAILNSPVEVIFARLKIAETNKAIFKEKTMRDAAKAIYHTHGYRGFFRGLPAHILHSTIWHSVLVLRD